jgi:hypothetical protein
MENTEIMNEAMDTVIEDVVVEEVIGKANNMNLVLKGGLAVAAVAAVAVLAKKGYDAYKAKKALRQPDKEIVVEAEDVEEVVVE